VLSSNLLYGKISPDSSETTDIIKKLFQNDLAKNDIDIRKSDIATSLLLMVTPEYISEKLLQIADKTKATQHS
ncbi:hypothetical protein, partial [Alistipes putredinis]|uniref:hypothetical protein n=1 Tax=Alistipes putredinis TaxID=28117 RepID=UPI00307747A4